MSSEIAIMDNGLIKSDFSELRNYRLRQASEKIAQLTQAAKKNLFEIAVTLLKIQTEALYEEDGFANIYEYGAKVLGYKKAMTNNLVRIAENYIDTVTMRSIIATDNRDYSVSQLQELLVIEPADAKMLADNDTIKPTMTTKAIRAAVKEFREHGLEDGNGDEEAVTDTTAEDNGQQYQAAYNDFHERYNALKEYLARMSEYKVIPSEMAVEVFKAISEQLLPPIMDDVVTMHEKR